MPRRHDVPEADDGRGAVGGVTVDERLARAARAVLFYPVVGNAGLLTHEEVAAALLATPSLRGLRELVDALEVWRESMPSLRTFYTGPEGRLIKLLDDFRGAISPEAPKP